MDNMSTKIHKCTHVYTLYVHITHKQRDFSEDQVLTAGICENLKEKTKTMNGSLYYKLSTTFHCLVFILIVLRYSRNCEGSSVNTLNHLTEIAPWKFNTTKWGNWSGRTAKLGDMCYYSAWKVHATPIIEAMKRYIEVKQDFHGKFKEAKARNEAQNPYDFLFETAKNLYNVRKRASQLVFEQMNSKSLTKPFDIRNSGNDASKLLQLLCEGGELLMCSQVEHTEAGICRCFNVDEVSPFYSTTEEDGRCMGATNSSCSPLDPAFANNNCLDALTCLSYTPAQCAFALGKTYFCDGYPKGKNYEVHNMICTHHGHHPDRSKAYSQTTILNILVLVGTLLKLVS